MIERKAFGCYDRRYLKEMLPVPVAMAVLVALKFMRPASWPVWPLKIGLAAVTAYTVLATVAAIRRLDELEQRIHLQAIAISFTVTGILVTSGDILEDIGFPHVGGLWVWMVMTTVWFVAALVLRRRYR